MNISSTARQTGLPVKTIRYYESIGLVSPDRRDNGYRDYGPRDIHSLQFIQRARGLGFSLDECRELLSLYQDSARASADVHSIALRKVEQIEQRIRQLEEMKRTLATLIDQCHGDQRPDCPILDGLSCDD